MIYLLTLIIVVLLSKVACERTLLSGKISVQVTGYLRVISEGHCLPFVELPEVKFFQNHKSALCNAEFVSAEISKLLKSGALVEVSPTDLLVCSPLCVAMNSSGKLRLIVDLRYINQYLRSCKFKYEDIRTAADLPQLDWFIKFDYTSGYSPCGNFSRAYKVPRLLLDG